MLAWPVDVMYFEIELITILMPGSPCSGGEVPDGLHDGLLQNMLDRISDGAARAQLIE